MNDTFISTFMKYRHLLSEFISRDIKLKYRNSVLGIIWSMLNPLLTMIVLSIVFSALFKRDIENFPVYVLTGRLVYNVFSESTKAAMGSIVKSGNLLRKIYVPKYIFPFSKICSTFVNFILSLVPLFIVMLVTGLPWKLVHLGIALPLIYLFIIATGVGLFLAAINVFFRDMQHFYSVILMIIMYTMAIFYPVDIIPEQYMPIIKLNPLFHVVEMFREVILYGNFPDIRSHILLLSMALIYLFVGAFAFYKSQDKFIHHV